MRSLIRAGARAATLGSALVGCLTLAVGPAGAADHRAAWATRSTPNPAGAQLSVLSAASCAAPAACTAVGRFTNAAGAGAPLAERWDGSGWTLQPAPAPRGASAAFLFAVSCPSRRACIAVGSVTTDSGATVPLAERWRPGGWTLQPVPLAGLGNRAVTYLGAVSCPEVTACTAVGYAGNAAGTSGSAVVERFNGARWTVQPTPPLTGSPAAFLSGVSCPSPADCVAVGQRTDQRGAAVALAERWDGTRWSLAPPAEPEGAAAVQLTGVSCPSHVSCIASGWFANVTGIEIMLAERWDGTHWSLQRTLYPDGARNVELLGVSCASPASCAAVGFFENARGAQAPLAEYWDGRAWTIQRTPDRRSATADTLSGVSCPAVGRCVAAGSLTYASGLGVTGALQLSGGRG
ncbi:MAG: hypothetical protein ABSH51_22475 [Solirubrobacteraceae bacterium]